LKRKQDRSDISNTLWEVTTVADFRKFPGGARIFSKRQPSRWWKLCCYGMMTLYTILLTPIP